MLVLRAACMVLVFTVASAAQPPGIESGTPTAAIPISDAVSTLADITSRFAGYLKSLHSYEVTVKTDWKATGGRMESGGGTTTLSVDGEKFRLKVVSDDGATTFTCIGDGKSVLRILRIDDRTVYSIRPGTLRDLVADPFTAGTLQGTGLDLLSDPDLPGTVMVAVSDVQDLGVSKVDGIEVRHFRANWNGRGVIEFWMREGNSATLLKTAKTIEAGLGEGKFEFTTTNAFTWRDQPELPDSAFQCEPPAGAENVPDIQRYLLEQSAQRLVGKTVPHVVLQQLDGSTWESDKLGKSTATIIYFWTTWAAAPIESLKAVNQFVAEYSSKGVAIHAINVREERSVVEKYVAEGKYPGAVALDPEGDAAQAFGVTSVPTAVLVDQQGIVQAVYIGQSLEVRKLVKEHIDSVLQGRSLLTPQPTPGDGDGPAAAEGD